MNFERAVRNFLSLAVVISVVSLVVPAAAAQDAIDIWTSIKTPPAPKLQPVEIAGSQTALLLLDFSTKVCSADGRPRCFDSLPKIANLLAQARSHGLLIVYSTATDNTARDIPPSLSPLAEDPVVHAGADKFVGTGLNKVLTDKGIRTVIVVGTSAQGAVLYTASAAALHGLDVIVPVDGMSSAEPFAELATAWIFANASVSVSSHVKLTRTTMISF